MQLSYKSFGFPPREIETREENIHNWEVDNYIMLQSFN